MGRVVGYAQEQMDMDATHTRQTERKSKAKER